MLIVLLLVVVGLIGAYFYVTKQKQLSSSTDLASMNEMPSSFVVGDVDSVKSESVSSSSPTDVRGYSFGYVDRAPSQASGYVSATQFLKTKSEYSCNFFFDFLGK